MLEIILEPYVQAMSNPFIYGLILVFLIVTQIFGVLYNTILVLVVPNMTSAGFVVGTIVATMIGESIAYYIGWRYQKVFKKKFPKVIDIIDRYTRLSNFLIGRFIGIPFLSYAMGVGNKITFPLFFFGTSLFVAINTSVMWWLGSTFGVRELLFIIIGLLMVSWLEGRIEKWYYRKKS